MWMCVDEDDNIMCGCGRFTWETQSVTSQSDSPVGMTNYGSRTHNVSTPFEKRLLILEI